MQSPKFCFMVECELNASFDKIFCASSVKNRCALALMCGDEDGGIGR